MDLELDPEQEALREAVRSFLADRAPLRPYVRSMLDDRTGTTSEVWQGLVDLGVVGLLAPAEHGGGGGDVVTMGVVLEALGAAVHPGPFLSSALGAVRLVHLAGSEADQAELLPALADGSRVGTVALAGDAVEGAPPVAASPRGTGWTLAGRVPWVADLLAADLLLVPARGPDGLTVFRLAADDPGVIRHSLDHVDGTSRFGTLELDDAPARPLRGGPGDEAVAATTDALLAGVVVQALGTAEAALASAVAYSHERRQFGVPIGSFQAVQHLCADMLRDVELTRAGAFYALWTCDAAEGGVVDVTERRRAVTMAKAFASDALPRLGGNVIQVFGGIGFTWEHDAHLAYTRLLTLQQVLGGAGRHLDTLADLVFGAPAPA